MSNHRLENMKTFFLVAVSFSIICGIAIFNLNSTNPQYSTSVLGVTPERRHMGYLIQVMLNFLII